MHNKDKVILSGKEKLNCLKPNFYAIEENSAKMTRKQEAATHRLIHITYPEEKGGEQRFNGEVVDYEQLPVTLPRFFIPLTSINESPLSHVDCQQAYV